MAPAVTLGLACLRPLQTEGRAASLFDIHPEADKLKAKHG
jgi:hypothetical protein